MTRSFVQHSVGVFYSSVGLGSLALYFTFGNYLMINPSDSNSVLGITMWRATLFDVQQMINYDDQSLPHPVRTLFWFYSFSTGTPIVLQTTGFFFDN